ncbi:MAG: shikimate dehydrogenase [Candidatus Nanopelagicales bacterium]
MTEVKKAGVLGSPISHSLSPVLHRAAYVALGLDWEYDAFEVEQDQLSGFLRNCGPEWAGLSLTMPLKEQVLAYVDRLTPLAEKVRAANTVVISDGQLVGDNTDVAGMVNAINSAIGTWPLGATAVSKAPRDEWSARTALIIGAGATARSAVAAITHCGQPDSVYIVARNQAAAAQLAEDARAWDLTAQVVPTTPAQLATDAPELWDCDLVVSTVPGTAWNDPSACFPQVIAHGQSASRSLETLGAASNIRTNTSVLLDVAYDPWPTPLTTWWKGTDRPVATGIDLLLAQAAEQVRLMTGRPAPVAAMRRAIEEHMLG